VHRTFALHRHATRRGSDSRGSAYLEDNVATRRSRRLALRFVESVLARAGARPNDRNTVDARIVADARAGTGSIIDSQGPSGRLPDR
jgi:hypothetical protein